MGQFAFMLKSNLLDLFKCFYRINSLFIFFSLISLSLSIYEDQIGKFDWRQNYIGKVKYAQFDTISTAKKIIVATEDNVLAALNVKTGQLVWRHVFESTSTGNIQMLHVQDKVITVTGVNPFLIKGWEPNTGLILWEWSITVTSKHAESSKWWVQDGLMVHVLPVMGSHIEVTMYNIVSGQSRGTTSQITAVWINDDCILTPPYYTCLSGPHESQHIYSLSLTSEVAKMINRPVSHFLMNNVQISYIENNTPKPAFMLNNSIIFIDNNDYVLGYLTDDYSSSVLVEVMKRDVLVTVSEDDDDGEGIKLTAKEINTPKYLIDLKIDKLSIDIVNPEVSNVYCTMNSAGKLMCRILVINDDETIILLDQEGNVLWTREESLAGVSTVEFVELPVSDLEAAIESEFDLKEGSLIGAFTRRISSQIQQFFAFIDAYTNGAVTSTDDSLTRDYFNLHKIIVVVTKAGKIFGMDNLTGELLWNIYIPILDTTNAVMYQRRSARHPPFEPYLTIIGKHEDTSNGLIISLNPITGELINERIIELHSKVMQTALLHTADEEKSHAIIILDDSESVIVFPKLAERHVENMFMYVADQDEAIVRGYNLKFDGLTVNAIQTYSVDLSGGESNHRLVNVVSKRDERVHSPGVVLADRSVLYKYINPNAVLFITEGPREVNKDSITATVLDVVSGAVITSAVHRKARSSPVAIHSENFVAYAYINEKHRRTEIASMELYEGKTRWSDASTPFSSLSSSPIPIVERQSYIMVPVNTGAVTTTERSITDKHVLFALSSGGIVEMPWSLLEPRRPLTPLAEHREEGLIPYSPELPILPEAFTNYNKTLERVEKVFTTHSGLESTSLVFVTGLDLFYSRVTPSKTFDLLKEDFDYYLITIVLAGLIAATYASKYFARKKMIRNAWL